MSDRRTAQNGYRAALLNEEECRNMDEVDAVCSSPAPMTVVFMVGQHRSGTSALAGALERCGLALGPVNRDPHPHNQKGHFSNPAIDAMNRALLAAPGTSGPRPVTAAEEEVIHWLLSAYPRGLVGIKNPDILFTLPIWAKHIERVALVGTLRHPLDAFRSSDVRLRSEGMSPPRELAGRWYQSNRRMAAIRKVLTFPIVDFSAPRPVYLAQLHAVAEGLGLTPDNAALEDFISEELVHQRRGGDLPPRLARLYTRLDAWTHKVPAPEVVSGAEFVRRVGPDLRSRTARAMPTHVIAERYRDAEFNLARTVRHAQWLDEQLKALRGEAQAA